MMRNSSTLCLGILVCTLTIPAAAAPAKSPFEGDRRLDNPVSLTAPMVPLAGAMDQLTSACGVKLSVDPRLSRETVLLVCRERPGRETLEQLAGALGYAWERRKGADGERSYRLYESVEALQRDRDQRLQYRLRAAGELDKCIRQIHEFEEKFRGSTDGRAQIDLLSEEAKRLPTGPARQAAELAHWAASHSRARADMALLRAYEALPPAARERVLLGERLVMVTRRPGTLPMPEAVLGALREARATYASEAQQTDDEAVDFLSSIRFGRLVLEVRGRRLADRPAPMLRLPALLATESQTEFGPPWSDYVPGEVTADHAEDLQRPVTFAWPGKKLDLEDPLTYCKCVMIPDVVRVLAKSESSLCFVGDTHFKALRRKTREAGGISQGADDPGQALNELNRGAAPGSLPLEDLLRLLADRGGANIRVSSDGWVRFRSAVHFQDREGDLDPDLLRELFREAVEKHQFVPATAVRAAGRLTYPQAQTLANEALGFMDGVDGFEPLNQARSWDTWKLLADLSEDQRARFLGGGRISYAGLKPAEQTAFRDFVSRISARPDMEPLDLSLGPRDVAGLSLSLLEYRPGSLGRTTELRLDGVPDPLAKQYLKAKWSAPVAER